MEGGHSKIVRNKSSFVVKPFTFLLLFVYLICNREKTIPHLPDTMTYFFYDLISTFHQSDGRVVIIQVWW